MTDAHLSPMRTLGRSILLALLVLTLAVQPAYTDEGEDVLAELQEALKWDDQTTEQVGKAMAGFKQNMAAVMAKYEDQEEPDRQAMFGDMKKARSDYQNELEGILGKDGLKAYNEYVEKVMLEMFSDIAEIRLLDLQPTLDLTDEQIEQLKPTMGKAYLDLMRTVFKYSDKKMNKRTKIKMGKELKKIQSSVQGAQQEVLSEEQLAKLEAYKESQKQQ